MLHLLKAYDLHLVGDLRGSAKDDEGPAGLRHHVHEELHDGDAGGQRERKKCLRDQSSSSPGLPSAPNNLGLTAVAPRPPEVYSYLAVYWPKQLLSAEISPRDGLNHRF